MSKRAENPMQPLVWDGKVIRFKENALVKYLLDWASARGCSLNELARVPASRTDQEQLAQLIGYSVSGFGELYYARDKTVKAANLVADWLYYRRYHKERS